ncbi:MAG: prepilin-type N-terminal cleavage/methylation domain-containing protein [Verrucomicrobia bacterium]|nr:prepilin-type N-terminal cleavage/methylation domain-containing protein [Verrucomicrobiota bacterium]
MLTSKSRFSKGFTLIELLTVIAIIGILAAIIIPTVGNVQAKAHRTTDLNNIKQVIQSAMLYANDNDGKFPGTTIRNFSGTGTQANDLWKWAGTLALNSGVNEPSFYISKNDSLAPESTPRTILNETKTGLNTDFNNAELSVEIVAGVRQSDASTTPIVFTRGLDNNSGQWVATKGAYKDEGGHVGYIGGNVTFYKDTASSDGSGVFVRASGARTKQLLQVLRPTASVYGSTNAGIGTSGGAAGSGP